MCGCKEKLAFLFVGLFPVSFSRHSGQMSPTNLLEREFNPESPPGLSKMESNKVNKNNFITLLIISVNLELKSSVI